MTQARVIIPEYRGYSLLNDYDSDMDSIKLDMRFFVKELCNRAVVDPTTTVLFVPSSLQGPQSRLALRQLPDDSLQPPLGHHILRFPVGSQDSRATDGQLSRSDGQIEVRQRGLLTRD